MSTKFRIMKGWLVIILNFVSRSRLNLTTYFETTLKKLQIAIFLQISYPQN
jgi:hypothetical protein